MGRELVYHCDCCGRENVHRDSKFADHPGQANDDGFLILPLTLHGVHDSDSVVLCKANGCYDHFRQTLSELIAKSKCQKEKKK